MTAPAQAHSFYFFDFDDNIMFLKTRIFVRNTLTRAEVALTTSEFALVHPQLGRPGRWEDFALFDGTDRDFRDRPADQLPAGGKQPFVRDVEEAVATPGSSWQAPSWQLFVYACEHQRPLSIVTARGHAPQTVREGVRALVARGLLPREPNYHTVFPVGNDAVRQQLGDERLDLTTPALKRLAIIRSADQALARYGAEPPHRFGMSDDDPQNVYLIIRAMSECKQRYPDKRCFVINTHFGEMVKLEVFPVNQPVANRPNPSHIPDLCGLVYYPSCGMLVDDRPAGGLDLSGPSVLPWFTRTGLVPDVIAFSRAGGFAADDPGR
jgi:hypothetical protein